MKLTASEKALGLVGIIALFLGILYLVTLFTPATPAFGGNVAQSPILNVATSSKAVAVTSSTVLLATTTNALGTGTSYTRVFATICNPSTTLVYVNMDNGKPASTSNAVAVIGASAGYNACYEITDRNLYQGAITASSTNQTSTSVIVTEYVQ